MVMSEELCTMTNKVELQVMYCGIAESAVLFSDSAE